MCAHNLRGVGRPQSLLLKACLLSPHHHQHSPPTPSFNRISPAVPPDTRYHRAWAGRRQVSPTASQHKLCQSLYSSVRHSLARTSPSSEGRTNSCAMRGRQRPTAVVLVRGKGVTLHWSQILVLVLCYSRMIPSVAGEVPILFSPWFSPSSAGTQLRRRSPREQGRLTRGPLPCCAACSFVKVACRICEFVCCGRLKSGHSVVMTMITTFLLFIRPQVAPRFETLDTTQSITLPVKEEPLLQMKGAERVVTQSLGAHTGQGGMT